MKTSLFGVVLSIFAVVLGVYGEISTRDYDCGSDLVCSFSGDTLTVSGTGKMKDFGNPPWDDVLPSLRKVVINEGVTSVGSHAFTMFYNLKEVSFPSTLEKIGSFAFNECGNLTNVQLPANLRSIGVLGFGFCKSITTITIPASLKELDSYVFSGCSKLASFNVEYGNEKFAAEEDVLFDIDRNTLLAYPAGKDKTKYTIPGTVKTLNDRAFWGASKLTTIEIPDSVTKIKRNVFYECTGLKSITIPSSVNSIGDYAFFGCTSLKDVTLSDQLQKLDDYFFSRCSALETVSIPDSVKEIGDVVFSYCSNLKTITLPENVKDIGYQVFQDCDRLRTVFYQGKESIPDKSLFLDCAGPITICVSPDYKPSTFGGLNVNSSSSLCISFKSEFDKCHRGAYVDGEVVSELRRQARLWEDQTTECAVYKCLNDGGEKWWRMCNSTVEDPHLCIADGCLENWNKTLEGWFVIIGLEDVEDEDVDKDKLAKMLKTLSEVSEDDMIIGIEADKDGNVFSAVISVKNETEARSIESAVNSIQKEGCSFDILCKYTTVQVNYNEPRDASGASSVFSTIEKSIIALFVVIQMIAFNDILLNKK